jgi:hypothetical protein
MLAARCLLLAACRRLAEAATAYRVFMPDSGLNTRLLPVTPDKFKASSAGSVKTV